MNDSTNESPVAGAAAGGGLPRRDFLKSAGGAAAAGSIFLSTARKSLAQDAAEPTETPNDLINLGFIGIGGRGSSLLGKVLSMRKDARVVAVCDVYAARRERAAAKCLEKGDTVTQHLHYSEILDRPDVDAVVIATPDHWHAPIALEAMRKGKDVYVEKPMTHTIPEAKEMAEAEAKLGRIVQVGSQTTASEQWVKARQAIADGMIGKLLMSQGSYHRNSVGGEWNYGIDPGAGPDATGSLHIDWDLWQKPAATQHGWEPARFFRFRKYWDYSGGIATDLFFHVMAPFNVTWPEPEFPWRVSGMGGIYAFDDGREVPDTFMLVADYPTGHSVVLSSSMANDTHIPGLIRGHEGTIMIVDHGKFEGLTPQIKVTPQNIGDTKAKFVEKWGSEEVEIKTATLGDPLGLHFRDFFDRMRDRQETRLSARKAYRAQVAITLGVHSYRQGKVMYFDHAKEIETDVRPASTLALDKPGVLRGAEAVEPA